MLTLPCLVMPPDGLRALALGIDLAVAGHEECEACKALKARLERFSCAPSKQKMSRVPAFTDDVPEVQAAFIAPRGDSPDDARAYRREALQLSTSDIASGRIPHGCNECRAFRMASATTCLSMSASRRGRTPGAKRIRRGGMTDARSPSPADAARSGGCLRRRRCASA